MEVLKCLLFADTKEFIEEKLAPWNYNTNKNSMSQNPLLYARLNLQVVYCYCWSYAKYFSSLVGVTKRRTLIGLSK